MKENKKQDEKMTEQNSEEVTKYGEFIASFNNWTTAEKQKKTAERLGNITKKESEN